MKHYSNEELSSLFDGVCAKKPLEELALEVGRPIFGIGQKIIQLSKNLPDKWKQDLVSDYILEYNQIVHDKYVSPQIEYHRKRVLDFLEDNPLASAKDLSDAGLGWDLRKGFDNRIKEARKVLNIGQDGTLNLRPKISEEDKIERVKKYFEKNPFAEIKDLERDGMYSVCKELYGGINEARNALQIMPEGYIYSKKAAEMLGFCKQDITYLFKQGKIEGIKLGISKSSRVFIKLEDVERILREKT